MAWKAQVRPREILIKIIPDIEALLIVVGGIMELRRMVGRIIGKLELDRTVMRTFTGGRTLRGRRA